MIRAVLFDVDGVLLDSREANAEFYQELFAAVGHRVPSKEELLSMHYLTTWDVIRNVTGLANDKDIQKIWNVSQSLEYEEKKFPTVPAHAEDVLRTLSQSYLLGIVTSRSKKYVYEGPLERMKLFFSTDVAFEDVTNHKPHPEPLLLAAQRLQMEPNACVYIGDAQTDIEAARAANMKIILYAPAPFGAPDMHAASFSDLPALIAKLSL